MEITSKPRKILLVLEAALGGTGRHILDLAEGLLERNHDVHLVYSPIRWDAQFRSGLDALQLGRPALRVFSIDIAREVSVRDIPAYRRLLRYTRDHGPFDVIHGHSTKAGFLVRLLAGIGGGIKVYTPHALMTMNPNLTGPRRWAVCVLESLLARLSAAIIVVSADEFRCAVRSGIPASKVVLIPNGLKPARDALFSSLRVRVRESLGLPAESICVGFVGRLCDQKAPDRVLDAFAIVKNRTTRPVQLVIVGSGPLLAGLKTRAASLGLQSDVVWAGQADGAAHMPAFDVLANCSRYDGFSYAVLEALSSGVPLVTTRVGGIEELFDSAQPGLVCDQWDLEAFSTMLLRVVEDDSLRTSLAGAARQVSAQFEATEMIDRTIELYANRKPPHGSYNPTTLRRLGAK
jgi:glycosyltransferase involved in cell wall biosynthesis